MDDSGRMLRIGPRIAALLCLAFTITAEADDRRAAPGPDTDLIGARWWQHQASIPMPVSPFFDDTGVNCGIGQNGSYWFLSTTAGNPLGEPVRRSCTIPVGKKIFVPLVAVFCIPFPGETVPENIGICKDANDLTDVLRLRIDGVARHDLIERRASARAFALSISDDNAFGYPSGIYATVHDGYFAILPPLEPGTHTVRVQSSVEEFGVSWDLLYRLHIVKPAREISP
ncbi:MAG TPA: hypothetical protein VFS23_30370 [Vicinamibacterales bacterium]|nr:hypothetical protein [Vicinamibacterales bacterium]